MQGCFRRGLFHFVRDELDVEDALVHDVLAVALPESALKGVSGGAVALHVEPEPQHHHCLLTCNSCIDETVAVNVELP